MLPIDEAEYATVFQEKNADRHRWMTTLSACACDSEAAGVSFSVSQLPILLSLVQSTMSGSQMERFCALLEAPDCVLS